MEYISVNNYDSELFKKKRNINILYYNLVYFNILRNGAINMKKSSIKKILIIFAFLVIKHLISILIDGNKINLLDENFPNLVKLNEFSLQNYFKNINENKKIFFNLTSISFSFDSNNSIIKVDFIIDFYDENKDIVIPSDLTLYYKFHIYCIMKDLTHSTRIISLPNIIHNNHFICRELFNINEKIEFKVGLFQNSKLSKNKVIHLFKYDISNFYKFDNILNNNLDCFKANKAYDIIYEEIYKKNITFDDLKLKASYFIKPKCSTKFDSNLLDNKWYFINLYNFYFCICKGLFCKYQEITQKYKYLFYLNIIDNNKDIYNKTDYLFGDFIYNEYSSDDAFPVFEKMIEQNLPAHYLTQNKDIYNKYCKMKSNCLIIIPVINSHEIIDGNFLEKYLSLILRLKATISGAEFFCINDLFYNIEYITHISLGHGISYLKHFLYSNYSYYGKNRYNKILIPFSKKLLSVAKYYGWNDENIIKINLPRWDKYNDSKELLEIKNYKKSIFIMFTWRNLAKNGRISNDYFKNIFNLLQNNLLIEEIQKNNVTVFFAFHHRQYKYKSKIMNYKHIKVISENQISNILSKTDLVVTDFSSIIFDIIYRQKPYIMYIPDTNYFDNKMNYIENYYKLIEDLKDRKIYFRNIYFNIKDVVNKIIHYIRNDFRLEKNLENFYKSFEFKKEKSIPKFIEYLKKLK